MSIMGYFTEVEMLQNKIKELEKKLQEEREEHRDVYACMKTNNDILKKDYNTLVLENMMLQGKIQELSVQHNDDNK
jgi:hypothetical protein